MNTLHFSLSPTTSPRPPACPSWAVLGAAPPYHPTGRSLAGDRGLAGTESRCRRGLAYQGLIRFRRGGAEPERSEDRGDRRDKIRRSIVSIERALFACVCVRVSPLYVSEYLPERPGNSPLNIRRNIRKIFHWLAAGTSETYFFEYPLENSEHNISLNICRNVRDIIP